MSNEEPKNEEPKTPAVGTVIQKVDTDALKQFVTVIKSAEHQVGEHIITALADDSTVAVLTTVVMGPDGHQRLVSAGLNPSHMQEVQRLLAEAEAERDEEIPCFGFHCRTRNGAASAEAKDE